VEKYVLYGPKDTAPLCWRYGPSPGWSKWQLPGI